MRYFKCRVTQDNQIQNQILKIFYAFLKLKDKKSSVVSKIKNIDSLLAFEASRKEARICRQEFEQVKKRRYDLFSQCFEHVSVAIDQIYKKLCRNNSAQVCTRGNLVLLVGVLFEWPAMGQSQLVKTGCHNDLCSRSHSLYLWPARTSPHLSGPVSSSEK